MNNKSKRGGDEEDGDFADYVEGGAQRRRPKPKAGAKKKPATKKKPKKK